LKIYRREGELWVVAGMHAGPVSIRAEPFHAIELELALLWPDRRD
jgi:hypothetical protein